MKKLITELESLDYKGRNSVFAKEQAIAQLNDLLKFSKNKYPDNILLNSLTSLSTSTYNEDYLDMLNRIKSALKGNSVELEGPILSEKFKVLRAPSQLEIDFTQLKENDFPFSLVFFDIDNFKSLNSKFTETVVDREILIPLQKNILKFIESRATAYSVGGDEFFLLLANVDQAETDAFCQRLVKEINSQSFLEGTKITISVGSSCFPVDSRELESLKEYANKAEGYVKKNGRNNSCSYASLE